MQGETFSVVKLRKLSIFPQNDDPEQQSKAARKTVQLVSQCGLWRKLPEEREESRRVTGGSSVEHGLLRLQLAFSFFHFSSLEVTNKSGCRLSSP